MNENTLLLNAARYLNTRKAQQTYVRLASLNNNTKDILQAFSDIAQAKGTAYIAKRAGLTEKTLREALREGGDPAFCDVVNIIRATGFKISAKALCTEQTSH